MEVPVIFRYTVGSLEYKVTNCRGTKNWSVLCHQWEYDQSTKVLHPQDV